MQTFTYYECMGNRDQTEGKGGLVLKRAFSTEDAAVEWVMSPQGHRECGVMGHGPGSVFEVQIQDSGTEDGQVAIARVEIWGYRSAPWKSRWDYGYKDLRDAPTNDPEYANYLRLKRKFD